MRAPRLLVLAIVLATQAAAQAPAPSRMLGIGVSFNPGALFIPGEDETILPQTGFNNLLFPIRTTSVTIEPEFGLSRWSVEGRATAPSTFTSNSTVTHTRLGIGFLKHFTRREGLEPYVGPRIGLIRGSSSEESSSGSTTTSSSKRKATNWYLGGAAGGQYFFSSHLTLGGEAQLRYTNLGQPVIEGTGSTFKVSGSMFDTIGLITLRWYF